MNRTDDPYAAPECVPDAPAEAPPPAPTESLNEIARSTFLAWEKLRPFYIGILALVTLTLGGILPSLPAQSLKFWVVVFVAAVPANLCYFAGPVVETYVRWLGYPTLPLRRVLFAAGSVFAALVAFEIIVEFWPI